jgi:hypothetical protein
MMPSIRVGGAMFIENQATNRRTHETAIGLARKCRHGIQAVLREKEWADADLEFYRIIRRCCTAIGVPA